VPAGATDLRLVGSDGVAGEETIVRFADCTLAARFFQSGSQIPRITMLPAKSAARKTTTRIIARRDMEPLQPTLAAPVKTNYSFREKNLSGTRISLANRNVSDGMPNLGGAIHESIHLYLCFADVDRATDRFGG
jgi:hypothetical protein